MGPCARETMQNGFSEIVHNNIFWDDAIRGGAVGLERATVAKWFSTLQFDSAMAGGVE